MQRDDIRKDDSVGEEISAVGQRAKGAIKDAAGAVTGNSRLEREGERENAEGRSRQASNYVTGLYRSPEEAGRAYDSLTTKHGYKSDDISVMMADETRKKHFGDVKAGPSSPGFQGLPKDSARARHRRRCWRRSGRSGCCRNLSGDSGPRPVGRAPLPRRSPAAVAGGATGGTDRCLDGAGIQRHRARI